MKKSLLVAALVAGFAATGAQAQSTVTLYGILDGGVQYQNFKGNNAAGESVSRSYTGLANGVNNGNRWGLKGSEDLGNGLKAVFTLESGFNIGTGQSEQNSRLFGRQATVGLQSDVWGLIELGRQTNIASKYFAGVATPFVTDFGQAGVGSAFSAAGALRYDNMIMYQTPTFAGLQFGLGYSFNADGAQNPNLPNGDNPNTAAWTTGLRYANGPVQAVLTYDNVKNSDTASSYANESMNAWGLAASYDFEVVKVHAAAAQTRNGWFSANSSLTNATGINFGTGTGSAPNTAAAPDYRIGTLTFNPNFKVNSYTLGLSAPIGSSSKVMGSWMMADPRSGGDLKWGSTKQHVYSLGYTYDLSKRTNLYALASYATGVNFNNDLKATQVVGGLRHRF